MEKLLEGEATFQDSSEVYVDARGDLDSAGFVQVMDAQTSDPERSKQLMAETEQARVALRPDILGQVVVGHEDGRFTMVIYFVNEEAARRGGTAGDTCRTSGRHARDDGSWCRDAGVP